jgi:hypothetical protein
VARRQPLLCKPLQTIKICPAKPAAVPSRACTTTLPAALVSKRLLGSGSRAGYAKLWTASRPSRRLGPTTGSFKSVDVTDIELGSKKGFPTPNGDEDGQMGKKMLTICNKLHCGGVYSSEVHSSGESVKYLFTIFLGGARRNYGTKCKTAWFSFRFANF